MPSTTLFFLVLVFVSCLGQVSSDLYLPSLPAIVRDLHTNDRLAELSVSVFMLGYGLSQLIYGPVSDAIGRRKPLMIGLLISMVSGLICMIAPSIYYLIGARLFQGMGAGAGLALARSMMRDRFDGSELAKLSTVLGILNVFVVASAPVIGGYLQHYFGWRANFIALFVYSLSALCMVVLLLSETSRHLNADAIKIKVLFRNFHYLLTHREFVGYSLCVFLAYGSVLAWVTVGPLLLQNVVGLTPVQFGWVAMSVGGAFILGGISNAFLVNRFGHLNMLRVGVLIQMLAGFLMLYFGVQHIINIFVIIGPLFLFLFGGAFIFPNSFAGALTPFEKHAGIASALFGFMQILGGSFSSFLISYLPDNNQLPIASLFICFAITALIVSFVVLREQSTFQSFSIKKVPEMSGTIAK